MFDSRRRLLLAASTLPFFDTAALAAETDARLAALENQHQGRLGIFALDTGSGKTFTHRAEERFAMCSSFKALLAAAMLAKGAQEPGLMDRRIRYTQADLVPHAPVTEKHLDDGMTVRELCDAIVRYSDNPGANLLLAQVGGPAGLTAWMRSIGDGEFRLDRRETELNSAIPGDARDTTTPAAMGRSLQRLILGDVLRAEDRAQLQDWLKRNTTGDERIRAGVPAGWVVGDKTGSGAYGTTNDIAVIWPPGRAPIVLVTFFTTTDVKAKTNSGVLAAATRIAIGALA